MTNSVTELIRFYNSPFSYWCNKTNQLVAEKKIDKKYKIDINNSKLIFTFLIFLIILLTQGYVCKYLKLNFCNYSFFINVWEENGLIENIQSLLLVTAIFFLYKARSNLKHIKIISYFIAIKILALIYFLGEEISWGQHFFNWESPGFFENKNNQLELKSELKKEKSASLKQEASLYLENLSEYNESDNKAAFLSLKNISLIEIEEINAKFQKSLNRLNQVIDNVYVVKLK